MTDPTGPFVWSCLAHNSRGYAENLSEIQHQASAHLSFFAESAFDDAHPHHTDTAESHAENVVITQLEGTQNEHERLASDLA